MTDFQMLEQIQRMIKEMPRTTAAVSQRADRPRIFQALTCPSRIIHRQRSSAAQMRLTPVTVRFASMFGQKGTADTVRNIKGMSVKFHGSEEYDMVCQSIPVFFIR